MLWEKCSEEKLTTDVKSRIIGCNFQMRTFSFFFGLCLGQCLYSLTNNLSKTLRKEKMSVLGAQRIASLTVTTIEGMHNDESFNMFYKSCGEKSHGFSRNRSSNATTEKDVVQTIRSCNLLLVTTKPLLTIRKVLKISIDKYSMKLLTRLYFP